MSTYWKHPLLIYTISLLATISSSDSSYYVQCTNNETETGYFLPPQNIDGTTTPVTLSNIKIPIGGIYNTCVLHIQFEDSIYNFEENSNCTIDFKINEVMPTSAPSWDPTVNPTLEPTAITLTPSQAPSSLSQPPTVTTLTPSTSPTKTNQTYPPIEQPTENPTDFPTADPTMEPTINPTAVDTIDLDELVLYNIFSVNDQNIFWGSYYSNNMSFVAIAPSCINDEAFLNDTTDTFAEKDVSDAIGIDALKTLIINNTVDTENISIAENQPLFPISFDITSHDTIPLSIFSYSQSINSFDCYYRDAFENTTDSTINYYLFIDDPFNRTNRIELTIDIIISTICISDPTAQPTTMPTATPTIDFNAFTTFDNTESKDGEDDFLGLGVNIEIFIAIIVVAFIILAASIVVGICLCKRKSIWEDDEDEDAVIRLKEPKTHKETELVTNKFMVTEEDHAEMIQLAKRNSLSTGLEV